MTDWAQPGREPKDGTQILAVFTPYPFPVMAVWCGASGTWCAAVPQVDMYQGELNDWYFENEHFPDEHLQGWCEVKCVQPNCQESERAREAKCKQ